MIEPLRAETTTLVLSNLGNPAFSTTTSNYTVYQMQLHITSLSTQIEVAYDYVLELIGAGAMIEPTNFNKIKLFMADYATLRVLGTLQGTAIATHFNYTSGGLNIQKPLVSQMTAMVEHYKGEVAKWRKLLLTRGITTTGPINLELSIPNEQEPEGSGVAIITYDSVNM